MNFLLFVIGSMGISAIVACGYNLILGKGKILHFGLEGQVMAVAYIIFVLVLQYQWSLGTAILLGLVVSLAIGFIFSGLALRLEEDAMAVMSIATHLITIAVVLNWIPVTRGALGLPSIPRPNFMISPLSFTAVVVGLLLLWLIALWQFDKSKYSRSLQALSEGQWHAQALGVSKATTYHITFAMTSIGVWLTAVLWPMFLLLLTPNDYAFPFMITIAMMVIAGGPGRLWGVLVAACAIVFMHNSLRFIGLPPELVGPLRLMLFGLILYGAIWWRRDSIFPHQRKI